MNHLSVLNLWFIARSGYLPGRNCDGSQRVKLQIAKAALGPSEAVPHAWTQSNQSGADSLTSVSIQSLSGCNAIKTQNQSSCLFFSGGFSFLFHETTPPPSSPLPPRPMAAGLRHLRSPGWIKPGSVLAAHTHNTTARTHTVSHHRLPVIWIIPQDLLGNVFCFELPGGKVSFRLNWSWKSSCVTWRLNNVVIRSPDNSELDAEMIQKHRCF